MRDPRLDRVAEGFVAACATGDVDALTAVRHDDVSGRAMRDDVVLNEVRGVQQVSVQAIRFFGAPTPWSQRSTPRCSETEPSDGDASRMEP